MIYVELPKGQKKIARMLIDKALLRECESFLQKVENFMQSVPVNGKNPHENYLELFQEVDKFDYHVARRYDNLGGSKYFYTVIGLYCDGVLSDEDISLFDEERQASIRKYRDALKSLDR